MTADNTLFASAFGDLQLQRYRRPGAPADVNLQAWDAADALLLEYLAEQAPAPDDAMLLVNDSQGALACGLRAYPCESWGDSHLSRLASEQNLRANGADPARVRWCSSLDAPAQPARWLLIKLPKTLALFEDQLCKLRTALTPDTQIICAGMVKYLSKGYFDLLEQYLGPTQTSLAHKKARLIFVRVQKPAQVSPYPSRYDWPEQGWQILNHANVFARQAPDIGSRFLLEHFPGPDDAVKSVADLGCGNGLLALKAAQVFPQADLHCFDESYMALASAQANLQALFPHARAQFFADDGMAGAPANHYDLVLNNPPFHQQQAVGDFVARQMFYDARRALKPGGQLWVIGNRHLGYHVQLKRLFGRCELVAGNNKFVVLKAVKP